MIELNEDQRREMATSQEAPPAFVDPVTKQEYVLVRADVYVRIKAIMDGFTKRAGPCTRCIRILPEAQMNRGEVVLVDWPYSDGTGYKLRPANVFQADFLNGLIDDTILVQITSKGHSIPRTEVRIDPVVDTSSGLASISYASCMNLLTIDQTRIDQVIGYLTDASIQQIKRCLQSVLDLP